MGEFYFSNNSLLQVQNKIRNEFNVLGIDHFFNIVVTPCSAL